MFVRLSLCIMFALALSGSSGEMSLLERIWSFDWRPRARAETVREVNSFSLKTSPVAGGKIRRPQGEFGVVRRGGTSYHKGIDFLAPRGTPVTAPHSGFICYNALNGRIDSGYGYTVVIDHGNNFYTLYAHLREESPLPVGEWVEAGRVIGRIGNSGNAMQLPKEFQNQLHFEIIHAPAGMMEVGGLKLTELLSPRRITTLRKIGEVVYGIYWGGSLNPEEYGNF